MNRTAILAGTLIAGVLGLSGVASAALPHDPGDFAVEPTAGFTLDPGTLEPGCFVADSPLSFGGTVIADKIDVTEKTNDIQVTVKDGAPFSVDQVLIPGAKGGYQVYDAFDTGTVAGDPDIDPGQTATDLVGPGTPPSTLLTDAASKVVVCVSDHPDASQNEPYVQAAGGEVAAINRPIITPFVSALGVSAVTDLKTYKVGFGYKVERWYDPFWLKAFDTDLVPGLWYGDPQSFDATPGDFVADHVLVLPRVAQAGVRRFNDIDEAGEAYSDPHVAKASYGQPVVFYQGGDPQAYLHKSLPGTIDGHGILDVIKEAKADQTSAVGLFTFTAQGDLPISWSLKPSLAPESYARKVTFTDDQLRAWETSWQDYYVGKGPKPALPLAPGTNSPTPAVVSIVNMPQVAVTLPGGTVVQAPAGQVAGQSVSSVKLSTKVLTIKLKASIRHRGRITYMSANGLRIARAHLISKAGKRLAAKVDLRGLGPRGGKWLLQVSGRDAHGKLVSYKVTVTL